MSTGSGALVSLSHQLGDHVKSRCYGIFVFHHAIVEEVLGYGMLRLIGYSNEGNGGGKPKVRRSTEDGDLYSLVYRSPTPYEVVRRAKSMLGASKYNLVIRNCEHFASWCATGDEQSMQVTHVTRIICQTGGQLAKLGTVGSIAAYAMEMGPDVGRSIRDLVAGTINGEECAHQVVKHIMSPKSVVAVAGIAGGATGAMIGASVFGPLGMVAGGIIGGIAASEFAKRLVDFLRGRLLRDSRDQTVEAAYKVLGVEGVTEYSEIKQVYHRLVRKHHPDKGGDKERFVEIQVAFEVITAAFERENERNKLEKKQEAVQKRQLDKEKALAKALNELIEATRTEYKALVELESKTDAASRAEIAVAKAESKVEQVVKKLAAEEAAMEEPRTMSASAKIKYDGATKDLRALDEHISELEDTIASRETKKETCESRKAVAESTYASAPFLQRNKFKKLLATAVHELTVADSLLIATRQTLTKVKRMKTLVEADRQEADALIKTNRAELIGHEEKFTDLMEQLSCAKTECEDEWVSLEECRCEVDLASSDWELMKAKKKEAIRKVDEGESDLKEEERHEREVKREREELKEKYKETRLEKFKFDESAKQSEKLRKQAKKNQDQLTAESEKRSKEVDNMALKVKKAKNHLANKKKVTENKKKARSDAEQDRKAAAKAHNVEADKKTSDARASVERAIEKHDTDVQRSLDQLRDTQRDLEFVMPTSSCLC